MKEIKVFCDHCNLEIQRNETKEEYIEIGSTNHSLHYHNTLSNKSSKDIIVLEKYHDLHFCSKQHFIDFFFKSKQ